MFEFKRDWVWGAICAAMLASPAQAREGDSVVAWLANGQLGTDTSSMRLTGQPTHAWLLGYDVPAEPVLGARSATQAFVGAWDGPFATSFIGAARTLEWRAGALFMEVGAGAAYLPDTSVRINTHAVFHLLGGAGIRLNDRMAVALIWRHWSNGPWGEKDYGQDYAGVQITAEQ